MKNLQVYLPYSKTTITQRFGDNANSLYASQGLKGHTAYDWGVPWGRDIPNCVADAYCYSVMNKDNPDLAQYRAPFFIVETDSGIYEISYGHCSAILAEVGKTYQVGDIIAKVGNTGPVYVGQHEVTKAEKDAGSQAGAHLHGPQIRVLKKTRYSSTYKNYIYDANGLLYKDGWYYGVPDYENGYNGCISLKGYSTETLATKTPVQVVADALPVVEQGIQIALRTPEPQKSTLISALSKILISLSTFLKELSPDDN